MVVLAKVSAPMTLAGLGGGFFTLATNDNVSLNDEDNHSDGVVHFVGAETTRFTPVSVHGWIFWAILLRALVF